MDDIINGLIENMDTKQQEIYEHVKNHPKYWYEFLKSENKLLSLYCDFLEEVNRFKIITLDDKIYLFEYFLSSITHYNYNEYYLNEYNNYKKYSDFHDFNYGTYDKKSEEILYESQPSEGDNSKQDKIQNAKSISEKYKVPVYESTASNEIGKDTDYLPPANEKTTIGLSEEKSKEFHSKLEALKAKHQFKRDEESSVNHPAHYTHGKYETIDVIKDWKLSYCLGNAVKYISRCDYKDNNILDLKKARFYLDYEIKRLEDEQNGN
jgi:hypothetical protein